MDSSYKAEISKHSSVVDNKVGFGGKYGVQKDRQDKVSCSDPELLLIECKNNVLPWNLKLSGLFM